MPSVLRLTHSVTLLLAAAGTTDASFLTYDPALARVRVDQALAGMQRHNLVTNPSFETSNANWVAAGGTLTQDTTQHQTGAASGKVVPTGGVAPIMYVPVTAVTAGATYTWSLWVLAPAALTQPVVARVDWRNSSNVNLGNTDSAPVTLTAGVWTRLSVTSTAPAGTFTARATFYVKNTPLATDITYIDACLFEAGGTLGSYFDGATSGAAWDGTANLSTSVLPTIPPGATRVIERSTDLTNWSTVRGGGDTDATVTGPLYDYEFSPVGVNHYRIRVLVAGGPLWTFQDQIVAPVTDVWLKFPTQPFLNRTVVVQDFGDVTNPSRGGTFEVIGRTRAVAVTDVRGADQYELLVKVDTPAAADDLKLALSGGQVVYVQGPGDSPLPSTSAYYWVGDLSRSRPFRLGLQRVFTLPLTEVTAPDASLAAASITWRGLGNRYSTWTDVLTGNATWADVLELQGTTQDVIVP